MSTNPFLTHAAPRSAGSRNQTETASALEDLAGLDLSSPTFSTKSQAHVPNALASPDAASPGPPFGNATQMQDGISEHTYGTGTFSSPAFSRVSGAPGGRVARSPGEPATAPAHPFASSTSAVQAPSDPFSHLSTTSNEVTLPNTSEKAPATGTSTVASTLYNAPPPTSDVSALPVEPSGASAVPHGHGTGSYQTPVNLTHEAQTPPAPSSGSTNPFLAPGSAQASVPAPSQPTPSLSYLAPTARSSVAAAHNTPAVAPGTAGLTAAAAPAQALRPAPSATPASTTGAAPTNQSQIDADEAIARALAQEGSADEVQWPLKDVSWNGRSVKIIMQNENGPCSLLALCNVLLLEQRIEITPPDRPAVSYSYLSSKLTELLVTQNTGDDPTQLSAALRALPSLQRGLDVNVGFSSPIDFSPDTAPDALALFRLARVSLVHGWLPDPRDESTYAALSRAHNYNTATLEATRGASVSTVPFGAADTSPPALIRDFLDEHATQLTPYGIAQLEQRMRPSSLAVLFRNAHLSVLYRGPLGVASDPKLYTLVTDAGFLLEDRIMWESLQDPRGQYSAYYDAHLAHVPYAPQRMQGAGAVGDSDYALAVELQNQERHRAMAARRRHRERQMERTGGPFRADPPEDRVPSGPGSNPIQKIWSKIKRK